MLINPTEPQDQPPLVDDLRDVAEPWRSVRLAFRAECRQIMAGFTAPPPPEEPSESPWKVAGRRLADIRRAKGYSQKQLAAISGYSREAVKALELGYHAVDLQKPRTALRANIAEALGCKVEDIWW